MKISIISFIVLCTTFIVSCDDFNGPCIKGSGNVIETNLDLPAVSKIELSSAGLVEVRHGEEQSVRVLIDDNLLPRLNTTVIDGEWRIFIDGCVRKRGDLRVYLITPSLSGVDLSSSGQINVLDVFEGDTQTISLSGSGSIQHMANAQAMDIRISGSGNIGVSGSTNTLSARISGSGDILAANLNAQSADVSISGSGSIDIAVEKTLNASISGSGNVFYTGDPTVNSNISGSGSVIDRG